MSGARPPDAGGGGAEARPGLSRAIEIGGWVTGLIGLIGIDNDLIEWSGIAAQLARLYRALADPLAAALSRLIGITLPPLAFDLLAVLFALLVASNAYTFRHGRMVASAVAFRMFWREQIRQVSADDLLARIRGDRADRLVEAAAVLAIWLVTLALPLLLGALLPDGLGRRERLGATLAVLLLWAWSVGFLSRLDGQVPQDAPGRFRSPEFRRLVLWSLLLLPFALLRYAAFLLYCVLVPVLLAWRWQVALIGALVLVLGLNELHLRAVADWPKGRPSCLLLSVPALCPEVAVR